MKYLKNVIMPKKRRKIPHSTEAEVLFINDRTCCICRDKTKKVQIHHIDENPSNNSLDNLAVVCQDHHDETHKKGGMTRGFIPELIKKYKYSWEQSVRNERTKRYKIDEPTKISTTEEKIESDFSVRKKINKEILQGTFKYVPKVVPVIITRSKVIRFIEWLRQFNIIPGARKENIENLFSFLRDADFTTGDIPPDDWESLELFKSWMCKHFKGNRAIEYYEESKISGSVVNIDKHLCSIGGPKDQKYTRYGMCYHKDGLGWEPILPYIYPLEDAVLRNASEEKNATILRSWKGKEWETINWYIADRNGKRVFTPGTDRNGVLNKDYFMLIVAPNTFTEKAINHGQKHLIIAPAHGLAQLAIKKILNDNRILKQLAEARQRYEYFQAIMEVPGKLTKNGYEPSGKFPLVRVEPLELYEFESIMTYKMWIKSK